MGKELITNSPEIQRIEKNILSLNKDLAFQLAQTTVDTAGIFDPSPVSDIIGAGMSLYSGDIVGTGLSLISIIPYAGDAIGKTSKGARVLKKIKALKNRIESAVSALNLAKKLARKKATAAVRAKRKAEAAKNAANELKCKNCDLIGGKKFGSQSPLEGSNGSWKGGERANSNWYPDPKTETGQEVLKATGGKPINFKEGYPDFSPYAMDIGGGKKARFEIEMQGNTTSDMKNARDAMRRELKDPNWPGVKGRNAPEGWTWHHNEDGITMELIPSDLNNNIPHSGGESLVNDPGF